MVGIDISGVQPDDVPGPWDFIVVKSTEGLSQPNFRVARQWANAARTTRGLYHYARPAISSGTAQANYFCDDALRRGFSPGKDLWQLDAEDGENAGVANWPQFITEFMPVALNRLGGRGFLYAGWPFVMEHGLQSILARFKWWLPDYGRNDGADHGYHLPASIAPLVVIHQFTSQPSLDQNVIVNPAAYGGSSAPAPGPATLPRRDRMVISPRRQASTTPGRDPEVGFDPVSKTFFGKNGPLFSTSTNQSAWKVTNWPPNPKGITCSAQFIGVEQGDVEWGELADGSGVFMAAAGDGGTFRCLYHQLLSDPWAKAA